MNNGKGVAVLEPRDVSPADDRSMVDVQSARAVAEVQASMAIAKKYPRDEKAAFAKIMQACSRKSLAEAAQYQYPRGGEKVQGPSIRLAEAIAQCWGNVATGVIELDRREGESLAMAYCVDLETNYRKDVTFAVPHIRDTKQGGKALTETRDIYELVMNMGSRRLRNCIMAVIPGDIFDAAEAKCMETLTKDEKPIQDRIREMLAAFSEYGVTGDMIASKFGQKVDSLSPQQLAKLRGIYQSLKDGMGAVADFFEVAGAQPSRAEKLNQESAARAAAKPAPVAPKQEAKPDPAPASEPGSFDESPTFIFNQPPKEETVQSLQIEIATLMKQLCYTQEIVTKDIQSQFKKRPEQLTLEELKRLRAFYQECLAKMAVK